MRMEQLRESAGFLQERLPDKPEFGLVLGSGLGPVAEEIKNPVVVPYRDVPHMAVCTVKDHAGQFVAGTLAGRQVLCMQGRLHGYEGHSPEEIVYPIRLMKLLGVRVLVLTNAAGGINTTFSVGDLMLIEDHINLTGKSPLTGPNIDELGPRFQDMSFIYPEELRKTAQQAAEDCGVTLQSGVYVGVNGPQFETPAEIRAFRVMGGDAVGMSTVFEAIAAAHCGLPVLAVSMITNLAAGVKKQALSGAEVNESAEKYGEMFRKVIKRTLELL